MHHFVKHAEELVLHFQKRRLDRNRIARMELTLVLDVLFYGGHPSSISCEPGSLEIHHRQQLPAGFIELAGVPHDVHVPHMFAVPRIDYSR